MFQNNGSPIGENRNLLKGTLKHKTIFDYHVKERKYSLLLYFKLMKAHSITVGTQTLKYFVAERYGVQECDATGDAIRYIAGYINKKSSYIM